MSFERRFEHQLPDLLEDIYVGPMPTYRNEILLQTARTRQRPAWSILERWLTVVDVPRQPLPLLRLPWRTLAVGLAVLVLLIALVAALIVGSRPNPPAPFGPARNGLIAYANGGEILTVDAATGKSTTLVRAPFATNPRWSRDGTHLAFIRHDSAAGSDLLYVVAADGSGLTQVTPQSIPAMSSYSFSPDGREILISASPNAFTHLLIAKTDGSGVRQLDLPRRATDVAWRPPAGTEILFMDAGTDQGGTDSGIYALNVQDGTVRTILAGADSVGRYRGHPAWAPDGSSISFGEWTDANGLSVRTHIVAADGTGDRALPLPAGAIWQAPESWSNDGTRLLVIRGYTGGIDQARPAVIPASGSGTGIEIPFPGGIDTGAVLDWEWSPDDMSILGTPISPSGGALNQEILDPVAGTSRSVPWSSASEPTWQRLGR